ncbi:MAG: hypothetical protein HXY34_06785 [Candidatus Thorarchaeota archaeon]|nr:hypothetical protein [Candidatus Thorarchaeota archaeon]
MKDESDVYFALEDRVRQSHFKALLTGTSEGRAEALGKYVIALAGFRMQDHVKRADTDPHPEGRVLPRPDAVFGHVSITLSYETAVNVLENASSFSPRNCESRMTYKKCDESLRICTGLDEFSDELERGVAETVSLEEARNVLHLANNHGIVHQVLCTDWLGGPVGKVRS